MKQTFSSICHSTTRFIPALLLGMTCTTLSAQPSLEGYWAPQFRPGPEGEALKAKIPAGAIFVDDAGGGELEEGDFAGLKLTQRALDEIAQHDFSVELTRDYACTQPSVAYYMQAPFPFEIHQSDTMIVMKMEYFDMYRIIHLDGRSLPPASAPHSKSGYSVGHWDGNELVVETTHIASATFMNNGFNHSDNIHQMERFMLSQDGNTLYSIQVTEDPEVHEGKAARYMAWRKVPGEYVYPYECDPSFGE
jgi:hypothetical protein